MIAHRGDTKAALENTLPAVDSALKLGVDGIEVDLRITRDGHVVVFHDDDLQRLAGRPEGIEDLGLSDIRKVFLKSGALIPTLEELLDLTRDRCLLNLELKAARHWSGALVASVVRILKDFHLSESILISSFQPIFLWRMKRLAPDLARGYLFESKMFLHRFLMPLVNPSSVNPPLKYVDSKLIETQHGRGRRVFVWTVNDGEDMKRLIDLGIDGLITDEPRRGLELLKRI